MAAKRQRFLPTTDDSGYIGQLRARREELGLTQGDLAKRAGLSLTTIWRVENGERGLSRQAARKIEEILGLASQARNRATGIPLPTVVGELTVTAEEQALLAMYRGLPAEDQEAALGRVQKLYFAAAANGRLRIPPHLEDEPEPKKESPSPPDGEN